MTETVIVSLAELDALIAERIAAESPRTREGAETEHGRIVANASSEHARRIGVPPVA